ncbi:hypothetical protein F4860DRAFT_496480 [Xylaria cubensis]|nr:hypothetical protein F4860DRAFT_496480 [Xylaria cubensis]
MGSLCASLPQAADSPRHSHGFSSSLSSRLWGILWEYFRQYKQLYARKVGNYIDLNDNKESLKIRIPRIFLY